MKSLKVLYGSLKARIRKPYLLVATAAVGAFLLLGILVPYFISGEEVKSKIISHVNQFSTHRLEIKGSLEIEGFPFPKMRLTDVTLLSPNKFGDIPPLLVVDTIDVDLDFFSMLTGSIEPTAIILHKPTINLYVNEDGEENWFIDNSQSNIRSNKKQDEGKKRGASNYVDDMLNSIPVGFLYSSVEIRDGTVQYDNHKTGELLVIEEYQQMLSMDGLDNEMSVVGSGLWNGEKSEWNVTFSSIRYLLSKHRTKVNAKIYNSLAAFNSNGHIENGVYKGNLILTVPSVRKMAHWIKQESFLQGFPSKIGLNINGNQLECAQSSCSMANANFKIEKIQGTTSFTWRYGSKIPFLDLDVNTNKANLTPLLLHYMEHKKFEEESEAIEAFNENLANEFNDPLVEIDSPKSTATAEKGWSSEPFNLAFLSNINANIKIGIKESLKIGKLEFGRGQFSAKLQDGYLSAQIANAEIYKGNANIRLKLDSKATPVTWNLSTNINAMDSLQLLSYFTEFRFLQGLGTMHADVASQGNNMYEVIRNLQGNGLLLVNDGRLKGVTLSNMFRSNDKKLYEKNNKSITEFTSSQLSFDIEKGIATTKDMVIRGKTYEASGSGTVNFPEFTLNYRLTPTSLSKVNNSAQAKSFPVFPIIISGDIYNPSLKPDTNKKIDSQSLNAIETSVPPRKNTPSNAADKKNTAKNQKNRPLMQHEPPAEFNDIEQQDIKPGEVQQKLLQIQRAAEWQKRLQESKSPKQKNPEVIPENSDIDKFDDSE